MPTSVGPNTFGQENLVFGYDLGDVSNSYKGEPTENLAPNADFTTSAHPDYVVVYNSFYSGGAAVKNSSGNKSQYQLTNSIPVLAGEIYTVTTRHYFSSDFNTGLRTAFCYELSNGTHHNLFGTVKGEWETRSYTFTITQNGNMRIAPYMSSTFTAGYVIIDWIQVEKKSHATQFTAGTRSATQGLLDLTGNSTINLSNVSFDSNAKPIWDGTDDYIAVTRRQYGVNEAWTTELVFKPTDDTDTSWNGLFGGGLGAGGYWMFHSSGNLTYYEGYDGTTRITYRAWTKGNTFIAGVYHHLTITYTPTSATTGTYNLYYNGGEKTDSFSWTFGWTYSLDMQFIGAGNGRFGTNDVHYFKQYDRALTASEVQSNYRAVKSRFNI